MEQEFQATFVVAWADTRLGGRRAGPLYGLVPGAVWSWSGKSFRMDGPEAPLILGAEMAAKLRWRAAKTVRRMLGKTAPPLLLTSPTPDIPPDQGFVLSDGERTYRAVLLEAPETGALLVMFEGALPPQNQPCRVLRSRVDPKAIVSGLRAPGGMICFTPGTRIQTPKGPRLIETLQPGDLVQTKDDGAMPVLWIGHRQMTRARLLATPHLRPIRFRAWAQGLGRPDMDLLVSPQHRMLVTATPVSELFNTKEALVAAKDLVTGRGVCVDTSLSEVTYIHLLLERHSILFANRIETESLHPASADLGQIEPAQRSMLTKLMPDVAVDPDHYGAHARRLLTTAEAAILRQDMAA